VNNVTHIYAFIADGEDSFMSMQVSDEHFPMVTTGRNLEEMKKAAAQFARIGGLTIRLVKFTNPEEVEVFSRHHKE